MKMWKATIALQLYLSIIVTQMMMNDLLIDNNQLINTSFHCMNMLQTSINKLFMVNFPKAK